MKDIAFHITDIAENSIGIGAKEMGISLSLKGYALELLITDNGCGMSKEIVEKVTNPFYTTRTTRNVGLGLPFLIQNAEQSGGRVEIESEVGVGTSVKAVFLIDNIDCPPTGDFAATLTQILAGNPQINTTLYLENGEDNFTISTSDFVEMLDGFPLGHPQVMTLIKDMINENILHIFQNKLLF